MITKNCLGGAITCVLIATSTVYAQDPNLTPSPTEPCEPEARAKCPVQEPAPQPTPSPEMEAPPPAAEVPVGVQAPWYERIGYGLSIGGGVDDFVSSNTRDVTDVGGGWNVRAVFGTKSYIAGEVAYIGSAQSFDSEVFGRNANLIGNGLEAIGRINVLRDMGVQPYLFIGAAWRHYDVTNTDFIAVGFDDSDDVVEMPFGVGVAGYIGGLMADVRGEYRGAWGNDILDQSGVFDGNGGALFTNADRWSVTANIGMEF